MTEGVSIQTIPTAHASTNFSVSPLKLAMFTECEENDSPVTAIDWCTRYLAVARENGSLAIYDTDRILEGRYTPATTIDGSKPLSSVAFGGGGKYLVAAALEGSVYVYSAAGDWALMHELSAGFQVTNIKWSPNGRLLAFAGEDNHFKLMDTVFWAEVEGANRKDAPTNSDTAGWGKQKPNSSTVLGLTTARGDAKLQSQ